MSSPTPQDGLPRPMDGKNKKSHAMSTRSGKTPSPAMIDPVEGVNWPTPAETLQIKNIKHHKIGHSPKRSPKSNPLSPATTTPYRNTIQEPKSVVSEERRRTRDILAMSRFTEAKQFMDEINNTTPSILSMDNDEFLAQACSPNGAILTIFAEKMLTLMNLEVKTDPSVHNKVIQNAIYFINMCTVIGVSTDIMLNTTDILHRKITPV